MTLPESYYTQGTPYYAGHGSYYRIDTYHCAQYPDLNGRTDRTRCAGKHDTSAIYNGPYTSACGSCWLGHTHTATYHTMAVAATQAIDSAEA